MAKIPTNPADIFPEITRDCQQIFEADLISIILYGSGAGADYVPGRSDLNFLIMLADPAIEKLDRAMEPVARWRKRNVAVPLFMTCPYLLRSLDAYPIEFLNMKRRYAVVYGRDILAELTFDRCLMRLQLERELRGKLLHLRSGYLATEGKDRRIRELITQSLGAFVSLFVAILYLRHAEIPAGKRDIITAAGAAFGFDAGVFLKCDTIRRQEGRFSSNEVMAVFRDYLGEVDRLCEKVDRMEVEP